MTRIGKVARLTREVREQLNRRLRNGETAVALVQWLNTLPEVAEVMAREFDGRAISEQNLSEWKQGGYLEWLTWEETLGSAQDLSEGAVALKKVKSESLADDLALVISARYAALMGKWSGGQEDEVRRQERALRAVCREVAQLRRGDHCAKRLELEQHRFALREVDYRQEMQNGIFDKIAQWPEVLEAFRVAYARWEKREQEEKRKKAEYKLQYEKRKTGTNMSREGDQTESD